VNRPHRARRLALQGLCCLDVQGVRARPLVVDFIRESKDPKGVQDEALALLDRALADRDAADELLTRHARHWDLGRLALVDRNLLRLAISEILSDHAPFRVAITEALHLAKEFSSAESSRFINGVLDAAAKDLRGDAGEG
jgi:N utilization substance protein B